jgi:hypothetical protein
MSAKIALQQKNGIFYPVRDGHKQSQLALLIWWVSLRASGAKS